MRGERDTPGTPHGVRAGRRGHHSERCFVAVARADPDDRLDGADPHLAVPDPARLGGLDDDADDVLGVTVVHDDLDPDLRDQRDVVLRAAVDLGVALLASVAADLADGHPRHAEGLEGLADVLPLVRLDDRGHELHAFTPSVTVLLARTEVGELLPPLRPPCRSYADSPCWSESMPSTSASSVTRHPIVTLISRAMA